MDSTSILALITAYRNEIAENAITPENTGYLLQQLLEFINAVESSLTDEISSNATEIHEELNEIRNSFDTLSSNFNEFTSTTYKTQIDLINSSIQKLETKIDDFKAQFCTISKAEFDAIPEKDSNKTYFIYEEE